MQAIEKTEVPARGLERPVATRSSVGNCMHYFIHNSPRMQRYFSKDRVFLSDRIQVIGHPRQPGLRREAERRLGI